MMLHAFISGFVQGVFFRRNTKERAESLDLTGFVRNLPDGRVEVMAEGPKGKLDELLSWLSHGPAGARVEKVEHEFSDKDEGFTSFQIS